MPEALFRLLSFGDVLDLGDEVGRLPHRVLHKRYAQQDPDEVALPMDVSLDHLIFVDPPGDELADVREVGPQVVRVSDRLEIADQKLLLGVAHDSTDGRVHLEPAAVE